jgi:GH15 family glucan-1,4-alpha-glucosidase
MGFISERFLKSRVADGGLPIMFTIRGETDIPERELTHLNGYRGSKPVRIGNGAAFHQQFDIYGELMDGIYLYNKYGKPVSWDLWCTVRHMLDYVLTIMDQPDMSIWEVRNNKQNFTYSKIMLWVAFDRGLRLSEKRNFPCPNRAAWLHARDTLYEEIMEKGYNEDMKCFIQSYESRTMLDSSILIAPLVFFIAPNDPRFLNTLDRIMLPPEKGGLTSTGLVYRYNTELSEDGEFFFPLVSSFCLADYTDLLSLSLSPRRRRPRGRLQHVHLLAGRGHDARVRLRAQVPGARHQPV